MSEKILEIACFNLESAIVAEEAGADRIELCDDYNSGGVTPSYERILLTKKAIRIPLHVIIRPRGGDFIYSPEEIGQMKRDILFCKTHNVNGVVFGCLTSEKKVDLNICRDLLTLSRPMKVTFHRAIDVCESLNSGVERLVDIGFDRVLTSGGENSSWEGKNALKALFEKFNDKIIVLPGGGIRSTNISEIIKTTNCSEYHSAALLGNSALCDANEIKSMQVILKAS